MREAARAEFLNTHKAARWPITPLAGDASRRRYFRLTRPDGRTQILMDADPTTGEDIRPFLHIAQHLQSLGFSVPVIEGVDETNGFILMEDFGDALLARVLKNQPDHELYFYTIASDVLMALHDTPALPTIPTYGPRQMADLTALASIWYNISPNQRHNQISAQDISAPMDNTSPHHGAHHHHQPCPHDPIVGEVFNTLSQNENGPPVVVLRDYHAENMIVLPQRQGIRRLGLLDFQDAAQGHFCYDLASLLKDVRRDVGAPTIHHLKQKFAQAYKHTHKIDTYCFEAAFAAQSAQRGLRILGVFARLCIADNKPHYIDFIPRVWQHLQTDLAHPELKGLRDAVVQTLPAPTQGHLNFLKSQCAKFPNP